MSRQFELEVLFANGMPFLATILKNIMCCTAEHVTGRQLKGGGTSSELATNHRSALDDVFRLHDIEVLG